MRSPRIVQFIGTGSRLGLTRGWGRGDMGSELVCNGGISVWEDEKGLEMDGGDSYTM